MAKNALMYTKVVRAIMRDAGKRSMWTNLYKKSGTRTVKCYRWRNDPDADWKLRGRIHTVLDALGVKHTVAFTEGTWYMGVGAVIVSFPKE